MLLPWRVELPELESLSPLLRVWGRPRGGGAWNADSCLGGEGWVGFLRTSFGEQSRSPSANGS